ncbi:MAG: TIM barrel protein [Planctomycetes bacterium]|jgi:hydroxypyruvate isomerase|nr:TIM barrel protein [Planctomycetota bacterium]
MGNSEREDMGRQVTRRKVLRVIAGSTAGVAAAPMTSGREQPAGASRIRQSIAYWCVQQYWSVEKTCQVARELGCRSVELVEPKDWPVLKKYGLVCAIANSHWFDKGMNNPQYHEMCLGKLREAIAACGDAGFPNVITFTGLAEGIDPEEGVRNCVAGYKKIMSYAEKQKVNLCLEVLNSRVAVEMVGVPGYQGDHTDYCMQIVRQVGSPRMKLLFDIFHVQIMDGDLIARIRQYQDYIGHYHTAGNPGRRELDDRQEINYRPILEEIARTGYQGYVGHEFIPTRDPLEGLRQAVALCDA